MGHNQDVQGVRRGGTPPSDAARIAQSAVKGKDLQSWRGAKRNERQPRDIQAWGIALSDNEMTTHRL